MSYDMTVKRIFLENKNEVDKLKLLLSKEGIALDKNVEYTLGIFEGSELIATGSFFKNTLRCLAVRGSHQGMGLLNMVVSKLISELNRRGDFHIFLYTKVETAPMLEDLGFYEIARILDKLVFMENIKDGIGRYTEELKQFRENCEAAAIVMNGNPFTLGHRYLVERAAAENDIVHLFVVSEEGSVIPFSVRYALIKEGVKDLKNVIVHSSGDYIISSATFPSYFLKEEREVATLHAMLDVDIFIKYIAKALNITKRYVGEEPYDETTSLYNHVMKEAMEVNGLQCIVVQRLEFDNRPVSASTVRSLIKEGNIDRLQGLLPTTTYEFFKGKEARELIDKIKRNTGRH